MRLLFYSDLYATLIVFVLCGIYKTLRAIALLFFSNFIHSFGPAEKSIPSQLYLLIYDFNFDILSGRYSFPIVLINIWL